MNLIPLLLLVIRPSACILESPGREPYAPFLSNYEIEDSCQYELCGTEYLSEFENGAVSPTTCAGQCDSLAQKLVTSKFKKEFLWGKCVEMCMERHPREEISSGGNSESSHQIGHRHQNQPGSSGFLKGNNNHHHDENHQGINRTMYNERAYRDRSTCMEDCFISYERVKPHHKIARACIHAACSRSTRASTDTSSLECFDRCAHHVSLRVPQSDWPTWSELLSTSTCHPKANQLVLDKLECTDRKLWERITKGASVSPDVLLLCLNGLCDHDIKCAKSCLSHVSSDIDPDDLSDWSRCTYSTVCAKIPEYGPRVRCSDKCLKEHKINQRRMFERQRLEAESERQKEEEARALSAGNLGSLSSSYSFQYSRSGSEHVFLSRLISCTQSNTSLLLVLALSMSLSRLLTIS